MTVPLVEGEHLLWEGRPRGWRAFIQPVDVFMVVFAFFTGLAFLSFAVSAGPSGTQRGPFPLVAFLFPVVFFGAFLIGPRLIGAWRDVRGTQYVVTDRRVVIRSHRREIALALANMPYLEFERSWLSGPSIFFGQRQLYEGWAGLYGGSPAPAFRGLPDAESVYELISTARARANEA